MTADQIVGWGVSALAFGFLAGYGAQRWIEVRRSARRHTAAELAFWVALQRLVDEAREDIDSPPSETPIFDALAVERLRADLDAWGA